MYSLTWLPKVLIDAGLHVVEVTGWQTRGHGDMSTIKGVLCHHTACSDLTHDHPSLGVVTKGRPDLTGPLAQLLLTRDGTYYIIAAGKAYHAGRGLWQGVSNGNSHFIGIEAENNGTTEIWKPEEMVAYHKGVAAILSHIKALPIMAAGHKEYALPKGRKIDPHFDMVEFRKEVGKIMEGDSVDKKE